MNSDLLVLKGQLVDSLFRLKNFISSFYVNKGDEFAEFDISIAELELMKEIQHNKLDSKNNACIADIQKHLYISKAGVSKMLGVLEKKGYINRDIDHNNRRNLIITLTQEGKDVLGKSDKDNEELLIRLIKNFGEAETKQLSELVNKFLDSTKEVVKN
jgi:DNA-binding MarR family transcriptional regulator